MINNVVLTGRLVADPELKYTPSGAAVCTITLAVDRQFKSADGEKQTDFFDIVCWRQSAEFAANYLTKGRLIGVEGSLQQRKWQDKDGNNRSKLEVIAQHIEGISGTKNSVEAGSNAEDYDPFEGQ